MGKTHLVRRVAVAGDPIRTDNWNVCGICGQVDRKLGMRGHEPTACIL